MLIKSEPTTTSSSPAMPAATVCGNCGAEERRLLHQVRHRSVFRRLCTTCVLRLHPQAFCPTCFQVYPPTLPNDGFRTCAKCYSHSHTLCVDAAGAPPPNPYVCPLCINPSAPIFKLKSANAGTDGARVENCRVMDGDAARMLLAAAKIASTSMNKAAVAAKAEAERRVKEAAYTRKRAKEALEHVAHLVIKEKARRKEAAFGGLADVAGRGYGVIPHFTPPGKIGIEINPNVGVSDRNVEDNITNVVNVDRENSNHVLAALNVVELGENEKMGSGMTEGLVIMADDHAPMDVDGGGMGLNVGENVAGLIEEMNNDMETDAGNGMVLVQDKQNGNGGEHVNGGSV